MIVSIHQPEYLGYLGYYNKMMNADVWIFLDNVVSDKHEFVQRNRIRNQNASMWLTVPVFSKGGGYQQIQDMEIDNTQPWRKNHWKSIQRQYGRAPFFEAYAEPLAAIYARQWRQLADLNVTLIKTMAGLLDVERPTYRASELGVSGKSSQLLADLTLAVGGDVYLSGPMGHNYLQEDVFRERNLHVDYNDFTHPVYSQGKNEFLPNLAAVDLLFSCGPAAREVIAAGGTLTNRGEV